MSNEKQQQRDTIVEAVCEDLLRRSAVGIKKYGTPLDAAGLNMRQWLQHAYEETLDQANYLKCCIMEIDNNESWMGSMVRGWIENLQPSDLKNRSIAELQDEIYRRQRDVMGDPRARVEVGGFHNGPPEEDGA